MPRNAASPTPAATGFPCLQPADFPTAESVAEATTTPGPGSHYYRHHPTLLNRRANDRRKRTRYHIQRNWNPSLSPSLSLSLGRRVSTPARCQSLSSPEDHHRPTRTRRLHRPSNGAGRPPRLLTILRGTPSRSLWVVPRCLGNRGPTKCGHGRGGDGGDRDRKGVRLHRHLTTTTTTTTTATTRTPRRERRGRGKGTTTRNAGRSWRIFRRP